MISKHSIKALNPCKDRLDNYLSYYNNKDFTPRQFMGLKNITHRDKLWVAFRMLPKETTVRIAIDIAESVLHIFEKQYPNDTRPHKAIEAAKAWVNNPCDATRNVAYAAAAAAAAAAAHATYAVAYAAYAAAYAAYAAYAVAYAAAYAAYAAYAVASGAAYAAARSKQEKLVRTIILRYWR